MGTLHFNSGSFEKGDVMALERNVMRLAKRLKSPYSKHAPQLLTISSCQTVQIKGGHQTWSPAVGRLVTHLQQGPHQDGSLRFEAFNIILHRMISTHAYSTFHYFNILQ